MYSNWLITQSILPSLHIRRTKLRRNNQSKLNACHIVPPFVIVTGPRWSLNTKFHDCKLPVKGKHLLDVSGLMVTADQEKL